MNYNEPDDGLAGLILILLLLWCLAGGFEEESKQDTLKQLEIVEEADEHVPSNL